MKAGERIKIRKLTEEEYERVKILYPTYDREMCKYYGKIFKIKTVYKADGLSDTPIISLENNYSYLPSWLESISNPVTKADFLKALK
jgi:hypothetical protein